MRWSIRKGGTLLRRPPHRPAADAMYRSRKPLTSSKIPIQISARVAVSAMQRVPNSRLTPCMPSSRALALLLLCWRAGAQSPAPAPPVLSAPATSATPATPGAPATSAYVGSETCQPCHEDIYNAFQKNPHKLVDTQKRRGWEARACESCHGPGGKHADSGDAAAILNPAKLSPAETD